MESLMIDLMDQLEHNPRVLDEAKERLRVLDRACRKHNVKTVAELLELAEEAEVVVSNRDRLGEETESKRNELKDIYFQMGDICWQMHQRRLDAIQLVQSAVEGSLRELGMNFSLFRVETKECKASAPAETLFVEEWDGRLPLHARSMEVVNGEAVTGQELEVCNKDIRWFQYQGPDSGIHEMRFMLAAGEGEQLQPLSTVASGGEAARILLALKIARSRRTSSTHDEHENSLSSISVFDELDSSIGGRLGYQIGNVLTKLSLSSHQVLCVTHLPQVAAHASRHIKMLKEQRGPRIVSSPRVLDAKQRVEELASMLGLGEDAAAELLDGVAAGRNGR
eukprot:scaffold947_cov375-Prasinococcus_capsulatus_cf.AAC.8